MKNLLIYVNPDKKFDQETSILAKIQIDNSLELGWPLEDILLVTNFPYEYRGVEAIVIPDSCFNTIHKQATKIDVMVYLFDICFIQKGILYWLHDFDAYQQEIITEDELGLNGIYLGLTDYGRHDKWNGGSTFLKYEAEDLYIEMKDGMYRENKVVMKKPINEEDILMIMTKNNFNDINSRIKRLNISYNFGIKQMELCFNKAIKPLKVLHFHPERIYQKWGKAWDIVSTNKNEIGKPIMCDRLINIFKKYGYK
jgi:hypothetical protein